MVMLLVVLLCVCVSVLYVCMCVRWGGYLSVRTLLSHSVMIKALCGTPHHTHSQPTSQLNRNCSAMQPSSTQLALELAHTHILLYTPQLSCSISFILPVPYSFLISLCRAVYLPIVSAPSHSGSLFNVSTLAVCISSSAGSAHCYTEDSCLFIF